jgi:glycine betaine/proline transport system ATP-binding protein
LHQAGDATVAEALLGNVRTVTLDADLNQLAAIALEQEHDVPVLDGSGKLAGVVSCRNILKQVMERRQS